MHSNIPAQDPFYYVTGSLDLTGMRAGETKYFNIDNSMAYETDPYYTGFLTINGTCIIGDVLVRTDPPVEIPLSTGALPGFTSSALTCAIGGARSVTEPVAIPYSAPFGFAAQSPPRFNGSAMTIGQLNQNPISYFGRTAARFPYGVTNELVPDTRTDLNYLGITMYASSTYPVDTPVIVSGTVHVKIKVYPKVA